MLEDIKVWAEGAKIWFDKLFAIIFEFLGKIGVEL